MKQQNINKIGKIIKAEKNSIFKVELENGTIITCTISGKIRLNNIRLIEGDTVNIEISPYDLTRGRINYKLKPIKND